MKTLSTEHLSEFLSSVEGTAVSSVDCLFFLQQYTRRQLKEFLKSCQHMPADTGYQRAKMLLEYFGNEHKKALQI